MCKKTKNESDDYSLIKTTFKKNNIDKQSTVAGASKKYRELTDIYLNGISAVAIVLKIEDTGFLFNYNPVVSNSFKSYFSFRQ
ncbi:MAG: hypothetical protein ABIY50_07165 [Ignavibacteria bacterium]